MNSDSCQIKYVRAPNVPTMHNTSNSLHAAKSLWR